MLLIFIILVLCCYPENSEPQPLPPPEPTWRQSRYIIDNRRNILFSSKPLTPLLLEEPRKNENLRLANDNFNRRLYPVEGYQKDLTAEASIAEPKYNPKYSENSLQRKILKSYKVGGALRPSEFKYRFKVFENPKNSSGAGYDPQNSIQNDEDVLRYGDLEDSEVVTTTEKVWASKFQENIFVSASSSTTPKESQREDDPKTSGFEVGTQEFVPPTTSFPWEYNRKAEEVNQIDTGEKHVYETRIETVSYHQEVIFNPPKKENWYQEGKQSEESEKNYEKPEENYEEPEKNYEEPEKNYEVDESVNVMSQGRVHGPEEEEEEENKNKFGYVVEGRNFRKYRVEERTADGFIVGEYGVVSHDDGSLRGVRYTADGAINPQLIYETLIKFLSL